MTRTTDIEPGDPTGPRAGAEQPWTVTALIRRHPRVAAATAALVVVLVAVTLFTTVSTPHRQALDDAASCSQWSAGTPAQQTAYSHLYIDEYGRGANTPAAAATVRADIDGACTHAAYLGEADDVSILAAMRHAF